MKPVASHEDHEHRRGRFIARLALAFYVLLLALLALYQAHGSGILGVPLSRLQRTAGFLRWFVRLAWVAFSEFAYFVPLGLLATMALYRVSPRRRWLPLDLGGLAVAGSLTVLLYALEVGRSWHLGSVVGLVLPLLGCIFGTWIGTAWLRGRRARVLLLPKLSLLVLLGVSCVGGLFWLSTEETPMAFEAAKVTSAKKRHLVSLIRSKSPRSLKQGRTHTLRLTENDINVLLAWGLSLGSPDRKAQVKLAGDYASLSASVGVPLGGGRTRYLNLEAAGTVRIDDGALKMDLSRCRLGSVQAPQLLLDMLCPVIMSVLRHDRLSRPFIEAIKAVTIEPNSIVVTYGRVEMPDGFREDIFGPAGAGEQVLASTRAQAGHLLAVVSRETGGPPSFGWCFETVFAFARDRSVELDPVAENRAAILALGILLGHHRLEEFLGPVLDGLENRNAQRALRRVRLRGRSDWTKHFCVSAAIAVLSDEVVSDAAGLLKEELDADIGRSGFSFADLLADRAGTTFALAATGDEGSARAMQQRIAGGFRVEEFFPEAADLPEGISDARLQSDYGGAGGERYRQVMAEIERRIAACAAYR